MLVRDDTPLVTLAVLCQEATQHADGTLTLTRILDQLAIPRPAVRPLPVAVTLTAAICVRAGSPLGGELVLVARAPSGGSREVARFASDMAPEQLHMTRLVTLNLAVHRLGEYWFDVLWDSQLLARMRLLVHEAGTS